MSLPFVAFVVAAGVVSGAQPAPTAVPSVSPTPLPGAPTAAPMPPVPATPPPAGVTPGPAGTPAVPVAPVPSPSPSPVVYGYRFVPRQPASPAPGTPQIFEVDVNSQSLQAHGEIDLRILTTPDVVSVATKSNGKGGPVPKASDGVFIASGRIPGVPFIAHGITFTMNVTAVNATGQSVTVGVPLRLK